MDVLSKEVAGKRFWLQWYVSAGYCVATDAEMGLFKTSGNYACLGDYAWRLLSNSWSFGQLFWERATLSNFCLPKQLVSSRLLRYRTRISVYWSININMYFNILMLKHLKSARDSTSGSRSSRVKIFLIKQNFSKQNTISLLGHRVSSMNKVRAKSIFLRSEMSRRILGRLPLKLQ